MYIIISKSFPSKFYTESLRPMGGRMPFLKEKIVMGGGCGFTLPNSLPLRIQILKKTPLFFLIIFLVIIIIINYLVILCV